jgi:hypothetical protein
VVTNVQRNGKAVVQLLSQLEPLPL